MRNNKVQTINLTGYDLYPWQREVASSFVYEPYRVHLVNTSRQIGKTILITQLILNEAINTKNAKVGVISLTYKQVKLIYDELLRLFAQTPFLVLTKNRTELTIELVNGSKITFLSVQNENNIRGFTFSVLFCDEFAYYKDGIWEKVIEPTTLALRAKVMLVSTPRGTTNAFYRLYRIAKRKNSQIKYHEYDYTYGNFSPEDIERIKSSIPDRVWKAEYCCEFTDAGFVFDNLNEICVQPKLYRSREEYLKSQNNKLYIHAGIDVALFQDFTVIYLLGSCGKTINIFRKNTASMKLLVKETKMFLDKWQPHYTTIEVNNQGGILYEYLEGHHKMLPITTTNNSKYDYITNLQRSTEEKEITLPTSQVYPEVREELEDFTFDYTATKKISYGALPGKHDDIVIALALANQSRTNKHQPELKKRKFSYSML